MPNPGNRWRDLCEVVVVRDREPHIHHSVGSSLSLTILCAPQPTHPLPSHFLQRIVSCRNQYTAYPGLKSCAGGRGPYILFLIYNFNKSMTVPFQPRTVTRPRVGVCSCRDFASRVPHFWLRVLRSRVPVLILFSLFQNLRSRVTAFLDKKILPGLSVT